MKATIILSRLRHALGVAGSSIAQGGALPITEQVWFSAGNNLFAVTGTDSDSWAEFSAPCEVHEPGEFLIHHQTLSALISGMSPDLSVEITSTPDGIAIKAGKSRARLPTMPVDDFPRVPGSDPGPGWSVTGAQLVTLASRLPWATSTLASRPHLQGISWNLVAGRMEGVATDGVVMALQGWPAPEGAPESAAILVPRSGIETAAKLLGGEGKVAVQVTGGWLQFSAGTTSYRTRLISEGYPDYRRVIPTATDRKVTLSREGFMFAAQFAEVTAKDDANTLMVSIDEHSVSLSAASDAGESVSSVAATVEGAPLVFYTNGSRLTGALQRIASERVILEMGNPLAPFILRPEKPAPGEEVITIVVPLRTPGT